MCASKVNSAPKKKVGRPANAIRNDFFSLDEGYQVWRCKLCTVFYGKTTASGNLRRHVERNHNDKYKAQNYQDNPPLVVQDNNPPSVGPQMTNMGYDPSIPQVSSPYDSAPSVSYNRQNSIAADTTAYSPVSYNHQHSIAADTTVYSPVSYNHRYSFASDTNAYSPVSPVGNSSPLHQSNHLISSYPNQNWVTTVSSLQTQPMDVEAVQSTANYSGNATISLIEYQPHATNQHLGIFKTNLIQQTNDFSNAQTVAMPETNIDWTEFLAREFGKKLEDTSNVNQLYEQSYPSNQIVDLQPFNSQTLTKMQVLQNDISHFNRPADLFQTQNRIVVNNVDDPPFTEQLINVKATENRKRKAELNINKTPRSLYEVEQNVTEMFEHGCDHREIQSYYDDTILNNPILLNAFLKRPLDTLNHIDTRFGKFSIGLLSDGLLGEKKDAMRTILKDKCNRRWNPCLFQLYIFSFEMRNSVYFTVELGYQNTNSQRRSCILDCVPMAKDNSVDSVVLTVMGLLRDFNVDNKLSDVNVNGTAQDKGLADVLKEKIKVKEQRSIIKQSAADPKNLKRIREFFHAPGINYENVVFTLQMTLANFESLLSELSKHYLNAKQMIHSYVQQMPDWSSVLNEQYRKSVTKKFQPLVNLSNKLKSVGDRIEPSLMNVNSDVDNHIYYLPTNAKEQINLLRIVPLHSYTKAFEKCNAAMNELATWLQGYSIHMDEVDSLADEFGFVVIDNVSDARTEAEFSVDALLFELEQNCRQGLRVGNAYSDNCSFLHNMHLVPGSWESPYVKELKKMSNYAPPEIYFDKFKKLAFLKSWKAFVKMNT